MRSRPLSRAMWGVLFFGMSLLPFSASAQTAYPIRFQDVTPEIGFKVYFTNVQVAADEVWYVGGSCTQSTVPARVQVVDFAAEADFEIYLSGFAYTADRVVCVVNPDAAPYAFWDAYER